MSSSAESDTEKPVATRQRATSATQQEQTSPIPETYYNSQPPTPGRTSRAISDPLSGASTVYGTEASADGIFQLPVHNDKSRKISVDSAESVGVVDHLSFREVHPVNVNVRDLTVTVTKKPDLVARFFSKVGKEDKLILDHINADMPAGTLTAIIGSSGSGKTSLLNTIAERMSGSSMQIMGSVTFNGQRGVRKVRTAYVMQEDCLIPSLTVRETLLFAAKLRLPSSTEEERKQAVNETILQLGLKECADTRIGDNDRKGCSGGEKRRTSIGVQLLSNPSVLFLDEPTTGLDATSAFQVIETLKSLSQRGRTIVTTIHQPRSEIWTMFDEFILLSRGQTIFCGSGHEAIAHFAAHDYPLPTHANPADYFIDITAIDYRSEESEKASIDRVESLALAWLDSEKRKGYLPIKSAAIDTNDSVGHAQKSFWRQISVLTRRTFIITYRDPLGIMGSMTEAIGLGVVAGWMFYQMGYDRAGLKNRQGALYTSAALQSYLVLLYETYRLTCVDIKVFDRERGEGVVDILPFLLSRRIARLFTEDVIVPFMFSVIFYFMAGFSLVAEKFFVFFSVVLMSHFVAVGFATVAVGISRDFSKASVFSNLLFTLQSFGCGFFVQQNSMGPWIRWTKYISFVYWGLGAQMSNEFTGASYPCPLGTKDDLICAEYQGWFILESLGIKEGWITTPILVLLGFFCGTYLLSAVLLYYNKVDINVAPSRGKGDDRDRSAGKEKMEAREASARTITVVLKDYKLDVLKYRFRHRRFETLEILKSISAQFEPGKLNVIMGPSGSGKSTLLNLIARRLSDSVTTKYESSGEMYFNGSVPSEGVIRSLCSYVTQDDDALLSSLTVRETLHFAAGLRLPRSMSKKEKAERAEAVLLKLGLKDCADHIIGSEFKKGISGGEKRRVTIAVQILTNPLILLLDEPTSGLDAFTAASILEVLKGLAEEGRTIITTIHQCRSDIFDKFGNLLLLARGGNPVYTGPSDEMLKYFQKLGHTCPSITNPADFALDLVTVNLQREDKEKITRARVQSLIETHDSTRALTGFKRNENHSSVSLPAELGSFKREMTSFFIAFPILVKRGAMNLSREPLALIARLSQVVGLGIFLALFFTPLKSDYTSVQNRLGLIQCILPLYFVGMLQNVAVYPMERDVFYRDFADRAYSTSAFFMAYLANELPVEVITSIIYSVLIVFVIGLPRTVDTYFLVVFNALCITSCGESLGIIFNTLVKHTGFAVNVTSTVLSMATLMAGIMTVSLPDVLDGINYLSPIRYAVRNLSPYLLQGQIFSCPESFKGNCPLSTGEEVLISYNLNWDWRKNMVYLAVCTVGYRIFAYFLLVWRVRGIEGVKDWWRSKRS